MLALSAAWACTNLLAGNIASLPIDIYRTDRSGQRTLDRAHPLNRILRISPNADQTAMDFWEGGCVSIELQGNLLALKDKGVSGQLIGLTPVVWDRVDVRRDASGALVYRWDGRNYGSDDVLHIRGFGGAPEGGLSTLAYGRQVFGLARSTERAAGGMFKNGLRPSGILSLKDFMTEEKRAQYADLLEARFQGTMNAGRPMVLEGGTTWTSVAMNAEDAQMLQSRGFSIEEVCRFFGVPPFMIGHTEKTTSWGTGLSEQVLGFQKFTLRRRVKRIEQALMMQLLTPAERAAGTVIEFNFEGLLRGDSKARAEFYSSALGAGWMTINEVRALENMPPVPGGDVPRMQSQNVPIDAPFNQVPAPQAA